MCWPEKEKLQRAAENNKLRRNCIRDGIFEVLEFSIWTTALFEGTTAGQPLAIYRRLGRTGDERRVGHVVLKKYLSRFAWTGWSYCTYYRKFVILCCVWLYCSFYLACLYCVSSCRTVSSLSLKYSIEEFASLLSERNKTCFLHHCDPLTCAATTTGNSSL